MFELTNETRDIKVNEVQFVPVTELTEMELSNILLKNTWIQNQMAKPVAKTQKLLCQLS
jgi:hypothetical protein